MEQSYGLQLYSVRDFTEKDLAGTLERVAEIGYKQVEFAGFFGHSAEDVSAMLKNAGLTCSGTHSSWEDLTPEKLPETLAYHRKLGNPNYIIPGADLSSLPKIERFCSVIRYAKPILEAEGIALGYHNHSHEFPVQPWGFSIYAELMNRTDLAFEVDTFWAFNAGVDPIALLDRLKGRVSVIHLKDGLKGGVGRALGEGEAPVGLVLNKALSEGLTVVVESEGLSPDGLSEVSRCMSYLKSVG